MGVAFTFDDASQLTAVSDPDSAYAYTYDAIGRLLTESNSGTSGVPTVVLTNTYDAASSRTRLTASIGGTADFQNDYSYDNLLRLTRLDQIGQSGGNTVASKRVDFGYDDASRLTEVVRQYKPSGTWTEVATSAFSYDTIDRLTGIDHKQGGTSLFTPYSYTFDNANRITGLTSQDGTVAYTYDSTSQITGADYSYQSDQTWSYTANGNWNMSGYSTGTNNKMTSDGVYNYTYDNEGNLILRVKISDSSRTEYTWDTRNRLINITERATQYGAATMTVDYVYDTFDRRISKSFDADGAGGGSAVTSRYVFDGSDNPQPILQFDGSNNLTHRDLWALDQIFAEEDSSNAILWNLGDNLGTVRDVIDNSGTVQNHLTYNAFHDVTSETNAAIDFLMGAAGMVRDEETGAHYAWHRYTQGGRWLGEDPIEFLAGDSNLMRANGNNPISYVDRDGLQGAIPMPQQGIGTMPAIPQINPGTAAAGRAAATVAGAAAFAAVAKQHQNQGMAVIRLNARNRAILTELVKAVDANEISVEEAKAVAKKLTNLPIVPYQFEGPAWQFWRTYEVDYIEASNSHAAIARVRAEVLRVSKDAAERAARRNNSASPVLDDIISGDGTIIPNPNSMKEVSKRQSELRRQLGLEPDPEVPIPEQKPGRNLKSNHEAKEGTPHKTQERNVNSKEEHSRRDKGGYGIH